MSKSRKTKSRKVEKSKRKKGYILISKSRKVERWERRRKVEKSKSILFDFSLFDCLIFFAGCSRTSAAESTKIKPWSVEREEEKSKNRESRSILFYATQSIGKVRGDQQRGNLRDTIAKRQQTTRRSDNTANNETWGHDCKLKWKLTSANVQLSVTSETQSVLAPFCMAGGGIPRTVPLWSMRPAPHKSCCENHVPWQS